MIPDPKVKPQTNRTFRMPEKSARTYSARQSRSRQKPRYAGHNSAELANLYLTAPVGLCFVDTELRYKHINEHLAALHGLSPEEHIGRTLDEVIPYMAETLKPVYRGVIDTGEPALNVELNSTQPDAPDGGRVWLGSYLPIKNTDGKVTGVSAVVQEITSHRRAIDDLRVFQRIVSSSSDHVSFVDADYVYRAVSDAYVAAYARPRDEIVGRAVAELLGVPTFRETVKPNLDRCLAGEKVRYQEWFSWPTMGKRFMDVVYSPHIDGNGDVAGAVVSVRDITERRQMEEELRDSQMLLATVTNTIEDVFWITDWNNKRILFASPAYEQIWGRSLRDLYDNPRDWVETIHPEDRERAWNNFIELKENDRYDQEYRVVRRDGSIRWVRDRAYPLRNDEGQVFQVVGIAQDITERKQAEETRKKLETQLRHVQKMQAVGQLAAGVAHDINSLLMVILGNAELAQANLHRGGRETLQRTGAALEQIQDAVQRGKSVIQKLLTFGRAKPRHIRPTNLNELIADMEQMLNRLISKDITVDLSRAPDLKQCSVDAGLIEQVILNLVLNARDAIPDAGTITVRAENAVVNGAALAKYSRLDPGAYVMLSVSDTGVGMDGETVERIFEPFFSTKPMDKGSGLGLAIVYGIVEQAGGHVSVESTPGVGTTFRIYFPAID
jgi:PAS domain S-box-containing protein